ncbi:MAG: hypothetical protein WBC02_07790 [Candidatus Aminicenantaceae bacterium]
MINDLKKKVSWKFIIIVGIWGIVAFGLTKLFIWRAYIYVPKPKLISIEKVPDSTREVEAIIKKLIKAGTVDKIDCQNYEVWVNSELWNRLTPDYENKLTCLLFTYCRIKNRGRQQLAIRDTYSGRLLAILHDCDKGPRFKFL